MENPLKDVVHGIVKGINARLPTILLLLGAATAACGIGLIYLPAGVIAAGAAMMALGVLLIKGGMVDVGKLRHRIAFQRFCGEQDDFGDPLQADDANWVHVATVWAAVNPISGREFYAAEQSQSEVSHKISCRYRTGLDTAMRITCGSRRFKIISIIDWEERHESLLIMCKELVQ